MNRRVTCAVVFFVAVSVGAVIFVLARRGHRKDEPTEVRESPIPGVVHSAESEYNRAVRKEIRDNSLNFKDSHGINTSLSQDYDMNTPLVEIHCKRRELDGTIRPLKVRSLYIVSADGEGGDYGVNGFGFRTELGRERGGIYRLLYGMDYRVVAGYEPDDNPGGMVHAKESAASFKTPDSLGPGEICSVELIVVDEIREQVGE